MSKLRDFTLQHPFKGRLYYKNEPNIDINIVLFKLGVFSLHITVLDGQYWFGVLGFGVYFEYW